MQKKYLEYQEYSNKSGRGIVLSKEDFIERLRTKCSEWLDNRAPLVRFKNAKGTEFAEIHPKESIRHSVNENNYTTMLMDNLPSWKKFPKRSESIIFYNNIKYGYIFGNELYFVIPFDGAKFGVSPNDVLWSSINTKIPILRLDDKLSEGLFYLDAPKDYEYFKKYMNNVFFNTKELENKIVYNVIQEIYSDFQVSCEDNFMIYFNELLAPENFKGDVHKGYKVSDYIQMKNTYSNRGIECWTDSNCLVYYAGNVPGNFQ